MGGFITLKDGRSFALNNRATDEVVVMIAAEVGPGALREWLLGRQSTIVGLGMTNVDLRELTPANADAIIAAVRRLRTTAPEDWAEYLDLLVDMIDAADRGDPPMDLNPHMREVIPPTGKRSGPGWDHQS